MPLLPLFLRPELVSLQQLSKMAENTANEETTPHPRPLTPHTSHHCKTVLIQDSPSDSSSDSDNDWFLKLLEPSPSSEDEWGGQSSSTHYTKGLVSDCPTITVHKGKGFKALNDSGAAIQVCIAWLRTAIKPNPICSSTPQNSWQIIDVFTGQSNLAPLHCKF